MAKDKLPNFLRGVDKKRGPWRQKACQSVRKPPKRKYKRKTPKHDLEDAVKKECFDYLKSLGLPVNRQNAGAVHLGTFHMKLATPGAADIVTIMPDDSGRHLEIECKRRDGKGIQSDVQKAYQAKIEEWGGVYLLVTSKEDLVEQLDNRLI